MCYKRSNRQVNRWVEDGLIYVLVYGFTGGLIDELIYVLLDRLIDVLIGGVIDNRRM